MIESEDEEDDDEDDNTGNKSDEGEGTLKNRPPALLPQDVLDRLAAIAAQSNENDDDDDESDEGAEPPPGSNTVNIACEGIRSQFLRHFFFSFHTISTLKFPSPQYLKAFLHLSFFFLPINLAVKYYAPSVEVNLTVITATFDYPHLELTESDKPLLHVDISNLFSFSCLIGFYGNKVG